MPQSRAEIQDRLRALKDAGRPIIGGGASTDLLAKCEEARGIDLIVIYNSGRYRMAGRGSLAGLLTYGNANEIVVEIRHTPVLAGVNGTDPPCQFDPFLDEVRRIGFSGVQNFPTVGLIDGLFGANLEETGMSYDLKVEMIARARAKDLLTTAYAFSEAEARKMAEAGADVFVCHLGLATGGAIGVKTSRTLADCSALVDAWADAALSIKPDALILVHSGPVAETEDVEFIIRDQDCHGFYGASSMERLPTEKAMVEQTRRFKAIAGAAGAV